MFPARRNASVQSAVIDASNGADRARNPLRRPGGGRCRQGAGDDVPVPRVGAACSVQTAVTVRNTLTDYSGTRVPAALPAKVPILRCWLLHISHTTTAHERLDVCHRTLALGSTIPHTIRPQHTSKGERLKCMCATRWQTRMPAPTASYHPAPKSIEGRASRANDTYRHAAAGRPRLHVLYD
jgi:hypothetical protein